MGVGEERGGGSRGGVGGGWGRKWGGTSVPRVPNPKLIPERDGSGGVSRDAHLCFEVSGACRLLSFAPEALILHLGRRGRVYIYHHVGAELLQLERVVSGNVAVRGLGARVPPGRAGCWRSLAVKFWHASYGLQAQRTNPGNLSSLAGTTDGSLAHAERHQTVQSNLSVKNTHTQKKICRCVEHAPL